MVLSATTRHLGPDEVILPGLKEPLHSIVRRGVNASVAYHRSVTVRPTFAT